MGAGPLRSVCPAAGAAGPYRARTPARVSVLMLPARGRVTRFVYPRVVSAVLSRAAPSVGVRLRRSGIGDLAGDIAITILEVTHWGFASFARTP